MKIDFSSEYISLMGRNDISEKGKVKMYYAGSQARTVFKGTEISLSFINHTCWGNVSVGYIIDGRMGRLPVDASENGKEKTMRVAVGLESDTEHELIIYKRYAGNEALTLTALETDGEFISSPHSYDLKIEVFGDSVCAGEVSEAVDFVGRCDPENHGSIYDNSWHSFVMQTSRRLNAEIHNIAQGGIAVFDDTGYFHWPKMIGMESVYDKMCYFPEAGEITAWDFSRYTPDVVIFALGQNDKHNGITDKDDLDINDAEYREKWKDGYKSIIRSLSEKYGKETKFVLTTTLLNHDKAWDDAIEEIKNELSSENIKAYHNVFKRNGCATHGHPRIPEHNEMADELTAFIKNIL